MELSRQEYPAMLASLSPGAAVAVLNDRVKQVGRLNAEIADWLTERRRIEEEYVRGLKKLSRRQIDSEDLGVFTTPWQKITQSAEAIADSHHILATKIDLDVERPLRDFATGNREMQAMLTIQGNLTAMAKEIEAAQRKTEKLTQKGGKASTGKVANVSQELENAQSQWDSQAPFVFEKLQAVDESRLNHLRDALTQFQTHEVDQVERNRISAEQTLNSLLNVETVDEIKTFAARAVTSRPRIERQRSDRPSIVPGPTPSPSLETPTIHADDGASQRSGSVQEQKSSGLHGLKRMGTFLNRRKSAMPYGRAHSPERKSNTHLGSSFSSFGSRLGKGKDKNLPPPQESPPPTAATSPRRSDSRSQIASRSSEAPPPGRRSSIEPMNGALTEEPERPPTESMTSSGFLGSSGFTNIGSSAFTNGTNPLDTPIESSQASIPSMIPPEPRKDAEGFSAPPPATDAISQAEQEAAASNEATQPQFKVDIRNAPIEEEDGDAETALQNVANALRMQATTPGRKAGTVRGRRDVRNTIFVPSPPPPEVSAPSPQLPAVSPHVPAPVPQLPTSSSPPPPSEPSSSIPTAPLSPVRPSHRTGLLHEDHAGSDTHSIRSGRSLSSTGSGIIRHPELKGDGLTSSLIENVSAWFDAGKLTRAVMIGELALAYNPTDFTKPFGTERIRLDNFAVLEKVAPNPQFIEQLSDKPGEYTVNLAGIVKTSVAFKYQVHLDDSTIAAHAPVTLSPTWKVEPTQASVILHYNLNPQFDLKGKSSITLTNLVLIINLDPGSGRPLGCLSKPVGTFSREKSLIYWRLGDLTLTPGQPDQKVLARFRTESEAKPGNVDARWEITGEAVDGLGSGLSVSKLVEEKDSDKEKSSEKEEDPFADAVEQQSAEAAVGEKWAEVGGVRKLGSGTYVAA